MYTTNYLTKTAQHPQLLPEYRCLLNSENIKSLFTDCADFESRKILFGLEGNFSFELCWIDGVVNSTNVAEDVIRPLTELSRLRNVPGEQECLALVLSGLVYSCSAKERITADEVIADLTHGCCALIFDGINRAVCFELKTAAGRAISEPTLEKSLKGAKDSFVETLRTNTSLVRRRICTPALKTAEQTVGRKSHTRVSILYIDGVASPDTVAEVTRRIAALDVDALAAAGTLEEYIVDKPRSPFPQLLHTERPDRFAMYLLDGRIGILVDGLPVGFVLPVTLAEFMKVTGDSSNHFLVVSFLSVLRWTALFISVLLPALYVAIAIYHQEMIPTKLLLSVIEAKQDVPFSTALEILGMLLSFELLQEAGLRLPNPVGDTVSIIGALIVGQSAVEAKVVSPIAIIVVALSGIACYTLPSQDLGSAVRLARFCFVLAAVGAGLFGVGALSCLLILHLASIDSFGVNYTAPVSDGQAFPLLRLLIQAPKPLNKYRDSTLNTPDKRRQA